MNYETMSLEELEQENIRLSNERIAMNQKILNKQKEVTDLIDKKLAEKSISDKINGMSKEEIKAMYDKLTQVVGVKVASNSGVSKNG